MSKKSVYKKDYQKKKPIKNKISIAKEYDKLQGPHLDMKTTYSTEFQETQIQAGFHTQPPEDLIKTGNNFFSKLTSYSSLFPGYRGANQYVKPTDRHTRGQICFKSKSTYSRTFTNQFKAKDKKHTIPDSLKKSNLWFGRTTYQSFFAEPNPESYAKRRCVSQKA